MREIESKVLALLSISQSPSILTCASLLLQYASGCMAHDNHLLNYDPPDKLPPGSDPNCCLPLQPLAKHYPFCWNGLEWSRPAMTNQLVLDFKSVVGHDPNALVEVGFIISRLDMELPERLGRDRGFGGVGQLS
ncbi:uncharacterized protein EURHEDRAFT_353671 [Aspergillus ruber CBS 135680]|uniref:Uncharacterized protein n=1 Tax=Aspergillus ruber (strain CBS 135680) TaxID=1388766 RepID=A0A017SIK9_ASPRC|nr:uncharacterized protein EURHEDRAFT_353671 [Aspergillus ruber CBS 135680]EYE96494.1 hypothetical protein EURHEDRAFT_353671 [Aspergillus ruber CBS 135680]